jgi:hypothetical protein
LKAAEDAHVCLGSSLGQIKHPMETTPKDRERWRSSRLP